MVLWYFVMVCRVILIFCFFSMLVILLLFNGFLGFLVVISFLIIVWIVVDEYLLSEFVFKWLEKKYFSLKIFWGVCINFCVVIWEIVDLCMFMVLVMLCSISGFMVFLFCFRKLIWCFIILVDILSNVLLWFCKFLIN